MDELVSVEEHVGVPLTNVVYDQILIYYTIRNWSCCYLTNYFMNILS